MSIIVHKLSGCASWQDVVGLPRSAVSECWNGESLANPFQWSLAVDSRYLWFVSEIPAAPIEAESRQSGEFVEGLWESNVSELFVMAWDGRYQEFNVSETGAWWAMTFSSYRVRASHPKKPRNVGITVNRSEQSWVAIMEIPISEIDVSWDQNIAFHICGIVHQSGVPTYLSSKMRGDFSPDFHDSRCYQRATWVAYR